MTDISITRHHAPRPRRARRGWRPLGVLAAVAALSLAPVPPPAGAADDVIVGSSDYADPVPIAVPGLNGTLLLSNEGAPESDSTAYWNRPAWFSLTADADATFFLGVFSSPSWSWDNAIEVWHDDKPLVRNDDYNWLDAGVVVTVKKGETYRIALGSVGWGMGTARAVFTTALPSAPTDLRVLEVGDGYVTLEWTVPGETGGGIKTYEIWCGETGDALALCDTNTGSPPSARSVITGLETGQEYQFKVRAEAPLGSSAFTDVVAATPKLWFPVALTVSPENPVAGDSFAVTVRVASGAQTATGQVKLTVNAEERTVQLVDGEATATGYIATGGVTTLVAEYSGDALRIPRSASTSLDIPRRTHTIELSGLPTDVTYGSAPVTPTVTSDRGLLVELTATGACSVSGGAVAFTAVGECTVTAQHAGDTDTEPASVSAVTQVAARQQVITLDPLPSLVYGQGPVPIEAESSLGLPLTLTGSGACAVDGEELVVVAAGLCTVTAGQEGDATTLPAEPVSVSTTVAKRADTVTITAFPAPALGAAVPQVTASSEHGLPVTLTAAGACRFVGDELQARYPGTCTVTAATDGDAVTLPASARLTREVVARAGSLDLDFAGVLGRPAAGARFSAHGTGLRPGTGYQVELHSTPTVLVQGRADATGVITLAGALPAEVTPGQHRLVVVGTAFDGSPLTRELVLVVAADGTLTRIGDAVLAVPRLATTGGPVGAVAALAAGWVALGCALVGATRRRRAHG